MTNLKTTGCFMEYGGKFIILHRCSWKPDGNTWGLPAGKVKDGETEIKAVLREINEETRYKADRDELELLGKYDFEFPELTLEFFTYRLALGRPIDVLCNSDEHINWMWVIPEECYAMPNLIRGFHDLLERVGYIRKSEL